MKNIKEKGKNIKGKRKIFRQQMAAVCGERAAVAAYRIYAESSFFALKGHFVWKVVPFIYQNHYLCSRNTKTSLKSYTYYILYGAEYVWQ